MAHGRGSTQQPLLAPEDKALFRELCALKHPVGGSAPPLTTAAEAAQRVVDDAVVAAASVMMQQFPDVSEEETALFKELYELKHPTAASNTQAPDDGQLEWSLRQAFGGASQSGQGLQPDELLRRLAEQQQVVMRRAVPTPMGPVFALPLEQLPEGRSSAMASAPPLPGSAAAVRLAQRAAAKAEKKAIKAAAAEARAAGAKGKAKKAASAKPAVAAESSDARREAKGEEKSGDSGAISNSNAYCPPSVLMPPPQPWLSAMSNPTLPPSAKAIAAAAARAGIAPVMTPFQLPGHGGPPLPPYYPAPPYLMPPAVPPAASQQFSYGSASTDNLVMLGGLAERRGASEEAEEALKTGRSTRPKRRKTKA